MQCSAGDMAKTDGEEAYRPSSGKKNSRKKKATAVKRTRSKIAPAESSEPEADGPTLGPVPCSLMPQVLSYCGLHELSKLCLLNKAFNTEAMDDKHYLDKVSSQQRALCCLAAFDSLLVTLSRLSNRCNCFEQSLV